jgi:hypothetical protein
VSARIASATIVEVDPVAQRHRAGEPPSLAA